MTLETSGVIADRTEENLSFSGGGVALYRRVLMENIEGASRGEGSFGLQRVAGHAPMDTNVMGSIQRQRSTQTDGRAPGAATR